MKKSNQSLFLNRVKKSLRHTNAPEVKKPRRIRPGEDTEFGEVLTRFQNQNKSGRQKRIDSLKQAATALNMEVIETDDPAKVTSAILDIAKNHTPETESEKRVICSTEPVIETLNLENAFHEIAFPFLAIGKSGDKNGENENDFTIRNESIKDKTASASIGITGADFCIADTATLVLKSTPLRPRSLSLLPEVHIAVVRTEQLVADLNELYTILKNESTHHGNGLTNCLTFITGASKTADIEAVMVHGVHGPTKVVIVVLRDEI
jgi:L-lactate dehydrogenase complex protein LldG